MMPQTIERKKRIAITADIIRLERDFVEKTKSTKEISELLGISVTAARSLSIKNSKGLTDSQILSKKGRKNGDNTEIKGIISAALLNENSLTQKGIKRRINEYGFERSQAFISQALKEMDYTRKRLTLVSIERNSSRILDARQTYARAINNLIYINKSAHIRARHKRACT